MTASDSSALPSALCVFAPLVPDVRNRRSTASPEHGLLLEQKQTPALFVIFVDLPSRFRRPLGLRQVSLGRLKQARLR
jgi:hypothetical protein